MKHNYLVSVECREHNHTNAWWWKQNFEAMYSDMVITVENDGWEKREFELTNPKPIKKNELKLKLLEIFASLTGCEYRNIKIKKLRNTVQKEGSSP